MQCRSSTPTRSTASSQRSSRPVAREAERVRVEIAFEGGHSISIAVPADGADGLRQALAGDRDGVFELEAEDGRYLIPVRNVVYVKRHARETHVGFGVGS